MSAGLPTRVPIVRATRAWAVLAAVLALGGAATAVRVGGGLGFTVAGVTVVAAIWLLAQVRYDACGGCRAPLFQTLVDLPAEVAQATADAVTARGSLDPARPNHLVQPGQPAMGVLIGKVCLRCRRCAKIHVARVERVQRDDQPAVVFRPLSAETLLDEASAVFLATLTIGRAALGR